ncbi:unnamed protein product [Ectocarpus sp. 6 AP-2014]
MAWLAPDKLDLTLESSEKLVGVLPSLLAVDPEITEDMECLVQFTSHLAEVNKGSEQHVEDPGRGGWGGSRRRSSSVFLELAVQ